MAIFFIMIHPLNLTQSGAFSRHLCCYTLHPS
jgi:hypothetical protein